MRSPTVDDVRAGTLGSPRARTPRGPGASRCAPAGCCPECSSAGRFARTSAEFWRLIDDDVICHKSAGGFHTPETTTTRTRARTRSELPPRRLGVQRVMRGRPASYALAQARCGSGSSADLVTPAARIRDRTPGGSCGCPWGLGVGHGPRCIGTRGSPMNRSVPLSARTLPHRKRTAAGTGSARGGMSPIGDNSPSRSEETARGRIFTVGTRTKRDPYRVPPLSGLGHGHQPGHAPRSTRTPIPPTRTATRTGSAGLSGKPNPDATGGLIRGPQRPADAASAGRSVCARPIHPGPCAGALAQAFLDPVHLASRRPGPSRPARPPPCRRLSAGR